MFKELRKKWHLFWFHFHCRLLEDVIDPEEYRNQQLKALYHERKLKHISGFDV